MAENETDYYTASQLAALAGVVKAQILKKCKAGDFETAYKKKVLGVMEMWIIPKNDRSVINYLTMREKKNV